MTQKFKVTRQVHFDKPYVEGDTYEGSAAEVSHLVASGVLVPIKGKAEAAPQNKGEPKPSNKAAG